MPNRRGEYGSPKEILHYDGLSTRISCSEPTDLEWLTEFLCPQFSVLKNGTAPCHVELAADSREWNALHRLGPDPRRGRRECFFLDTRIVRLPVWASASRDTILFDEDFGAFCIVDGLRTVRLLKPDGKRMARLALMRVVREFAVNHAIHRQRVIVHGAACVRGDRGILIAGQKGWGKTSMLLRSLQDEGAHYVSNDRVAVSVNGDTLAVCGVPTIINLRVSTLKMFPDLYHRLQSSPYNPVLSLDEADGAPLGRAQAWRDGVFTLSPAQLCTLMGVGQRPKARLTAVLFPHVTNAAGTVRLERVPRTVAIRWLMESLYRSGYVRQTGSLFSVTGKGQTRTVGLSRRLASDVVRRVPCYVCHLGRAAYVDGSWLDDVG